jgi:hypothetical protein
MLLKPIKSNNHMDLQHKPMETVKRDKKIKPNEIFENYTDTTKPKKSNKSNKMKKKKKY